MQQPQTRLRRKFYVANDQLDLVLRRVKKMIPAWNLPGSVKFSDALAAGHTGKLERVNSCSSQIRVSFESVPAGEPLLVSHGNDFCTGHRLTNHPSNDFAPRWRPGRDVSPKEKELGKPPVEE